MHFLASVGSLTIPFVLHFIIAKYSKYVCRPKIYNTQKRLISVEVRIIPLDVLRLHKGFKKWIYPYKVKNIDTKQSNKRNTQNPKFTREDYHMK